MTRRYETSPIQFVPIQFVDANGRRTADAARVQCKRAASAIRVLKRHRTDHYLHNRYLEVLGARVMYPQSSLAEIAALNGETKDRYWSALRRAFAYADRLNGSY